MEDYQFEEKQGYVFPDEKFDTFGCFMGGELVTIVAESNSGKTTFAMQMIERNANNGRKGFYINLEFAVETVYQSQWLWLNGKDKTALTDLNPLTDEEKKSLQNYVNLQLNKFASFSDAKGISLKKLIELIRMKYIEGFELFVVDTFSRIEGNLGDNSWTNQNKCMEQLQSLAQELGIAIVLLHHTNRQGTWGGTQKIMDLSNVFILIEKDEDCDGQQYRRYKLMKDKFTMNKELELYYKNGQYVF